MSSNAMRSLIGGLALASGLLVAGALWMAGAPRVASLPLIVGVLWAAAAGIDRDWPASIGMASLVLLAGGATVAGAPLLPMLMAVGAAMTAWSLADLWRTLYDDEGAPDALSNETPDTLLDALSDKLSDNSSDAKVLVRTRLAWSLAAAGAALIVGGSTARLPVHLSLVGALAAGVTLVLTMALALRRLRRT